MLIERHSLWALAVGLIASGGALALPTEGCVPPAAWVAPGRGPVEPPEVHATAARRSVVLLGETHEIAAHHRWQLQVLAALHSRRPDMVIGFEMFPRSTQAVLDRWVAGELSESAFLQAVDWHAIWGFDADLYLPLFHFARMNRIPMVALNISRELRRSAAKLGFDQVPESEREGVTPPRPPTDAYLDYLLPIYAQHGADKKTGRDDPGFRRFAEVQTLWDRAMAEILRTAAQRESRPLVVGIMGTGHIAHGHGVPHQLRDLGVSEIGTMVPWETARPCGELVAGVADVVFGIAPGTASKQSRPRLGVRIESGADGVRVAAVEDDSIGSRAGLRAGDVIVKAAGRGMERSEDLIAAVRNQAPGTWLPLEIVRDGATQEIIAKFPPEAE